MNNNALLFSFSLPVLVSLAAGGGGGSSSNPRPPQASLSIARLSILATEPRPKMVVTNSRGEFKYHPGETVTFFIGDLEFPSVLADERVTPLDMADTDDVFHPYGGQYCAPAADVG